MQRIIEQLESEEPNRIVFAGDSITHGALHTYGWRDYGQLFSERLRYELERHRDFCIKTASSGWTTQDVKKDIDWNILQFEPSIVSIMLGTNDAKKAQEGVRDFEDSYNYILDELDKCRSLFLLHTMNPVLDSAKDILGDLPLYAQAVRNIALQRDLPLIDHYSHWEQMRAKDASRIVGWMNDQTHPNERGHRAFARLMFKELNLWDPENSRVCMHCVV